MARHSTEPTTEGVRLIQQWQEAEAAERRAQSAAVQAGCDVLAAKAELGKWLLPEGVKDGEAISIWYGDSLITASRTGNTYSVTIRKRGRSMR